MSATNWAICPKCVKLSRDVERRIEAGYGILSREEYLRLVEERERVVVPEESLREDYEVWIDEEGKFKMYYGGRCDKCGFTFSYRYEELVL